MANRHTAVVLVAALAGLVFADAASAGLSGPSQSYATPTRDGKYLLVMLSPAALSDDRGNVYKLPNGETVKLREHFPSSGLYEIGPPPVAVWTVDWYAEKGLARMSPDGRYVVRVNRFGGGRYGEGVTSHWCLVFYERGTHTKTYEMKELVDFPSLMEFTPSDWHYLWIDDSVYDAEIQDGSIVLQTTTHESYRFDVATGKIVSQFRLWRWAARGTVLAVLGLVAGWFYYRRAIRKPVRPSIATPPAAQFSLRSLFVLTTLIAALLGTYLVAVHWAVFLTSAVIAVSLTLWEFRARRRVPSASGFFAIGRRWIFRLGILTSWIIFYALSCVPVMALAMHFRLSYDVRMVLAKVVYWPVWRLVVNTPIRDWQATEFYFRAWGM